MKTAVNFLHDLLRGHRRILILGILIIPVFYFLYTSNSLPRRACHIPSWNVDQFHFVFEITPYLFILLTGVILFRFSIRALRDRQNVFENGLALLLAFFINVFSFALVYYNFGVTQPLNVLTSIPTEGLQNSFIGLTQHGIQHWLVSDSVVDEGSFIALETKHTMVTSAWSHLAYSLANSIPGNNAFDYEACSSGHFFVLVQNIFGLGITVIASIFVARITRELGVSEN